MKKVDKFEILTKFPSHKSLSGRETEAFIRIIILTKFDATEVTYKIRNSVLKETFHEGPFGFNIKAYGHMFLKC